MVSCFKSSDYVQRNVASFAQKTRVVIDLETRKMQVTACDNKPDVIQLFAQRHVTDETPLVPYVDRK